jgi:hypothetical protein
MRRKLLAGGATAILLGIGFVAPAIVATSEGRSWSVAAVAIVVLAGTLVLGGTSAIVLGLRRPGDSSMPAPARAVVLANMFFLAFCALETTDGLLRQEGRLFYWTSVLFVPALLVQGGLISARPWAWWLARGVTVLFVLWFAVFSVLIPFVDLRGSDGPVPWWGRLYMIAVSLLFASIAGCVLFALGRTETRAWFGVLRPAALRT